MNADRWLADTRTSYDTVEAQMLIEPDESVPGAVLFARRQSTAEPDRTS
ncbi:hypothetical protein [Streptomyces sp. NBC_01306]|nr:hypothetical protein [Streptomyces sp. NBC_01306]MCX4725579.1 hypothetical protein [Streptomyces sp. NBC_01306]